MSINAGSGGDQVSRMPLAKGSCSPDAGVPGMAQGPGEKVAMLQGPVCLLAVSAIGASQPVAVVEPIDQDLRNAPDPLPGMQEPQPELVVLGKGAVAVSPRLNNTTSRRTSPDG